jgi:hypothetical protein
VPAGGIGGERLASERRLGYRYTSEQRVRIGGIILQLFSVDHEPRHGYALYAGTRVVVDLLRGRTVAQTSREDAIEPANAKRSESSAFSAALHFDVVVAAREKMHP